MPFPRPKAESVLICVLLDGLGYDLVQRSGFLADLLDDVRPLRTVLGYSPAAQASILTGLLPYEHGGLCVYYRSSRSIFAWLHFLHLLPTTLRRRLERNTVDLTRRLFRITGHFNIWEIPRNLLPRFQLYERRGLYTQHPIQGVPTILDEACGAGIPVSAYYWNTSEDQIFAETESKLVARQADFHFLYLARTDHLLHLNGTALSNAKDELEIYADRIRRIHQLAKENYHAVKLAVFSDHGMLDVVNRLDVMSVIADMPYQLGKDYLAFYDATMVRLWFDNPACRQPILEAMSGFDKLRLLSGDELGKLGSLFPDQRYGETIYLAERGTIISPSFFGSLDHMRGMHGYHPEEPGYEAFVGSCNLDLCGANAVTDLYSIMRSAIL